MEWVSGWIQGIIIAVIISTIIEMILPEGNSKKYIKVVIGIYVLFTIVSPVITKISGKEIQVSDILDLDEYIEEAKTASETQNQMELQNEDNILSIYVSGIKEDMKAKIEAKGYVVNNIDIKVANDGSYTIQSIALDVENMDTSSSESLNQEDEENLVENVEGINKIDISISINSTENNSTENNSSENNSSENNSSENSNIENNSSSSEKNSLSITQKQELKDYISSVYEVDKNNITIN